MRISKSIIAFAILAVVFTQAPVEDKGNGDCQPGCINCTSSTKCTMCGPGKMLVSGKCATPTTGAIADCQQADDKNCYACPANSITIVAKVASQTKRILQPVGPTAPAVLYPSQLKGLGYKVTSCTGTPVTIDSCLRSFKEGDQGVESCVQCKFGFIPTTANGVTTCVAIAADKAVTNCY